MTFVTLWYPALPTAVAGSPAGKPNVLSTPAERSLALQTLAEQMLTLTPHVIADQRDDGVLLWADARGLPAARIARTLLRAARRAGLRSAAVGVSRVAIVAEIAARTGETTLTTVTPGEEREFVGSRGLALLAVADAVTQASPTVHVRSTTSSTVSAIMRRVKTLIAAFDDVGIETCDDLARLTREAVEVRFGAEAVALWRLARGDDTRRLFRQRTRTLPSASLEWFEFELRDPERLVFVANRLAESVCTELQTRGETARAMTLTFALVSGDTVTCPVRGARPTADRATWLRLVRAVFERVTLPDAVSGLTLAVEATHSNDAPQGDLFDQGFQTGAAGEAAVARLVDDETGVAVQLMTSVHPLPEQRVRWRALETGEVTKALRSLAVTATPPSEEEEQIGEPLALRLLAQPRRVAVTTRRRRGYDVPVRYRERLSKGVRARNGMPLLDVLTAAGPDSMSVGQESGAPVVREYWQCLNGDGQLVLLFRNAAQTVNDAADEAVNATTSDTGSNDTISTARGRRTESIWYLHGWWD